MIYHAGLDAHDSNSFFQHMDAEGTIGLSEWVATAPDSINELLAQLDEPTTITFEAG